MIKQTVQYTDFNGNERNEDFYFHLSSVELIKLEARIGNKLDKHIEHLAGSQDVSELLNFLESIILDAYGVKSKDGKSFLKSPETRSEFEHSQAYANLFEKMLTDEGMAATFGAGIAETNQGQQKKNQVAPTVVQVPDKE